LRVIAGIAKGRRLHSPHGSRIRPTSDRVKEAVFSIISAFSGTFPAFAVLDIFAGTGNLGIEALSRGAESAVFVDNHRDSVALIKKNLQLTGFMDRSTVIFRDAVAALKTMEDAGNSFGLVFIDPPYYKDLQQKVLEFLSTSKLLVDDSIVVVEHSSKETIGKIFGSLQEFDERAYGDTAVAFYTLTDRGKP
jgi:16S rRNA (guanine966-N2)-methyltransferase